MFKINEKDEDNSPSEEAARKITRVLEPGEAKRLQINLSSAIAETNTQG